MRRLATGPARLNRLAAPTGRRTMAGAGPRLIALELVQAESFTRDRANYARAVLITTTALWLLSWIKDDRFDPYNALWIAIWVSAVLGALTLAAHRLAGRRMAVWRQLVALALTAGIASSLTDVAFLLAVSALSQVSVDGAQPTLGAAAVVGFFDGDALFGFWALLVELPRRIGAERRLEQEREALRQEAELARIRSALEPHFVLNTLNAIAGLVTEEPTEARNLLAVLGDLLRDIMEESRRSHHTVRDEVRWLRGFARILESRHFGRLAFEWHVDGSADDCILPVLLLQPLLENAVHHGALRRAVVGRVVLRITGDAAHLRCAVEDDGPGFERNTARSGGRGLELVRRRLAVESSDASLEIDSRPGQTRVAVTLPMRIT